MTTKMAEGFGGCGGIIVGGIDYVSVETASALVRAEREACAKQLMDRHDELQQNMTLGVRPMASMITGTLREIADELSPGYVEKRYAANMQS